MTEVLIAVQEKEPYLELAALLGYKGVLKSIYRRLLGVQDGYKRIFHEY